MNQAKQRALQPQLRDEERALVENAVRLAIDSIVNVLSGVGGARTHEYKRMVADRDKEIQRLEGRLREIERELQLLRAHGCTCGLFGAPGAPGARHQGEQSGLGAGMEDELGPGMEDELGPGMEDELGPGMEDELGAGLGAGLGPQLGPGQQECEMSISLGLFARPPSHVSSQSHESAFPSSPGRLCLDQSCTSGCSETSGLSETARNLPPSPSSLVVKEEPCDVDTVLIKWEMSEERFEEHQESAGSPCPDKESPGSKKKQETRERKKFREKPQADPDGLQVTDGENLRNKKKSVPMSELPEEAQRLKRAAWRAASRRYYARKIARQQANPSRSGAFPHISAAQFSQPISFVDKRRRTLISELPEESQTLQREAWRAASRRYYARKMARHQTDPSQYGHLLQT